MFEIQYIDFKISYTDSSKKYLVFLSFLTRSNLIFSS